MSSKHRAGGGPALHLVTASTSANYVATAEEQRPSHSDRMWISVERAARTLDMHPTTFRRHLERNIFRGPDGSIEARVDGIVARKLGNRWKVLLGPAWLAS